LTDTSSLLNEALAGRYFIEREIGRGGMSCVYLAHDIRHGRSVALKVLHPELGAAIGADRFLREIQVVARLQHPHIVPLYDSGEASGRLYYVMPYVKGESMRERLKRDGPINAAEAQRIIREVADALDYAHSEGIVHRDIKPDNIILDDRHAMVTDFGIARALSESGATLTQTGVVIGTPAYMSPEQITGDSTIDGRSDIYSLGCVLFEMLSGKPPFASDSVQAMMVMRFAKPTPSLEPIEANGTDALKGVIAKAMRLAPAERFQTAREILIALDNPEHSPAIASAPSAPFRIPTIPLVAGAAALLSAVGLFSWKARSDTTSAPPEVQVASIGVLPFANRSGDKQMDYFSDGLTDELISALSHVAGLQVAGRASSFSMKGKGLDTQDAARRLHVAYIVDAGVRSSGSRVRVTWQLVDARTDRALGSGDIDGEIRDAISLQDSMAKTIVDGLRPVIGIRNTGAMKQHQTANPEAHDLYLKGHFYWNQRTTASMREGINYLKQAIEKDSTYALAWAELASVYTLEQAFGDMPPSEAANPGRQAAQKAVELDSTLAEAYTARGMSEAFNDWNPNAALIDLDKAIRLDPQNSFPRLFRVWPLVMIGRMDEALAEIRRAKALDPLSPIINTRVGTVLLYAHKYDEAAGELRKALDLDPTNILARFELGRALSLSGRMNEALQQFTDALDLETGHDIAVAAVAYGQVGEHARARNILTRLEARSKERYISPVSLCIAAIGAGDKSLALDYLDQALNEHSFFLVFLSSDPSFDAIREEPRFMRVKERVERQYASSLLH
jgi:serine/threonine-protein kinase